jgi:hypothetical protein
LPQLTPVVEALQLFSHDLLQHVPVQREIGDQAFELAILFAQLPQLTQFVQGQAAVLFLPDLERGFADAVLAANIRHPFAALGLMQCPQNLFLAARLLGHPRALLVWR